MTEEELYKHCRRAATAIARDRFSGCRHLADDLISEGVAAGMLAARKFDPARRVKLSTFVGPYIRGAMFDYYRREFGRSYRDGTSHGSGVINRLTEYLGVIVMVKGHEFETETFARGESHEEMVNAAIDLTRMVQTAGLTPNERCVLACCLEERKLSELALRMNRHFSRMTQLRVSAFKKLRASCNLRDSA